MVNLAAQTLVALLEQHAKEQPDKLAFEFLEDRKKSVKITYGELAERARAIAVTLLKDLNPGDRALLLYAPGIEYIAGFFGCLYAGVIAVPAYPPTSTKTIGRLLSIVEDADTRIALTTSDILLRIRLVSLKVKGFRGLKWVSTNKVKNKNASQWIDPDVTPETVAFLQYTSGSTSTPKGVILTHGNLLANLNLIYDATDCASESRGVFWLPPYHDMGLIGAILGSASAGHTSTMMSPVRFIKDPLCWLETLSDRKATHTGGPNFAYDLCVRKLSTRENLNLDLSSLRMALNGAEPIRSETIERFVKAFEPYGFRKDAFLPAYGLAEYTVYVSGTLGVRSASFDGGSLDRGSPESVDKTTNGARTLIGCGFGAPGVELAIVDPVSMKRQEPGRVGEIWLGGASMAKGYWGRPELSQEYFEARMADDGSGPFLRTGDLGFFHQDELFIAGRIKDLLIIRGRNHYPQDIELTIERSHRAVRPGGCAAFSFDSEGEEQLGVACELGRNIKKPDAAFTAEIISAIREGIALQHQVEPLVVVLLRAGTIPKTSSGKIQRHAAKNAVRDGSLSMIAKSSTSLDKTDRSALAELETSPVPVPFQEFGESAYQTETEREITRWLVQKIAEKIGVKPEEIDPSKPIVAHGIDSVTAVELVGELENWLDIGIDATLVYDYPTPVEVAGYLATLVSELPPRAPATKGREAEDRLPSIAPAPLQKHEPFPLTAIQKAYLAGRDDTFELGGFGTCGFVQLETRLDMERLEQAFNRLIARHEMLHTIIFSDGTQRTLEQFPKYSIEIIDMEDAGSVEQEERLSAEKSRLRSLVFDPSHWPLFELKGVKVAGGVTQLLVCFDMLIVDGFSFKILERELLHFYHCPDEPLDGLEVTFRDYVVRLDDLHHTAQYKKSKSYWLDKLPTISDAPKLPFRRLPSEVKSPEFQRCRKTFSPGETERLEKICLELGLQLPAVLATAYALVLGTFSNQDKLTLNFTVFNRYPLHKDVLGLVGDFTSVLLVEADLGGGTDDFVTLVKALQRTIGTALRHRHFDGVELIQELAIARGQMGQAVMPVVFTSMLYGEQQSAEPDGWSLGQQLDGGSRTPQVVLDNQVSREDGCIQITWDYPLELFDPVLIREMFEQYVGMIARVLEGETTVSPTLPERHRELIEAYNETSGPVPVDTLDRLFTIRAAEMPDRTAIETATESMTYGELDKISNQVARKLQSDGLQKGQFVAVMGERTCLTIANLLGVLKAGGAYVPIDPTYPRDRQKYIYENNSCRFELNTLFYEDNRLSEFSASPLKGEHTVDDLAYTIYTSGSTGRPKGVVVDHRAAANTIVDINQRYDIGPDDRLFLVSSLGFDLSVYDVFGAFAAGATLVIADSARDLPLLAKMTREKRITVWNTVPAIMDLMLDAAGDGYRSECLKLAMWSGDWIPLHLFEKAKRAFPRAQLISQGGATEGAIWSIYYPIEHLDPTWKSIPYGYPLTNQQFHVVDHAKRPCPVDVPGELYIGGAGVARCYMNNPEETARSFIEHPTLGYVYRTGDMGVFRSAGYIEFLGRQDHQVKIRGYRIELGEIETCLLEYDDVTGAVVIDRTDESEIKYLVAYLVAAPSLTEQELVERLSKKLPDYMIPTAFVGLDEIPLTANGKVDRKSLPDPSELIKESGAKKDAGSELEAQLTELWRSALGIDNIGPHDNFFAVGGDSIVAQRLLSDVRCRFGVTLPIADLFRRQTIAELASYLEENLPQSVFKSAAPTPISGEQRLLEPQELFAHQPNLFANQFGDSLILDEKARQEFKQQALNRTVVERSSVQIDLCRDHSWPGYIEQRRTHRSFDTRTPIPFETFSKLLTLLSQQRSDGGTTYYYASAGGLYPLDVYLHIKPDRVEQVSEGLYLYEPKSHRLVLVNEEAVFSGDHHYLTNVEVFRESALSIHLFYNAEASMPVLGSNGYFYALIEAGRIAQLLAQSCEHLGLGLCSIEDLAVSKIRDYFHTTAHQTWIHTIELGIKRPEHAACQIGGGVIGRTDRSRPLPLSFGQQRLWFLDQYETNSALYSTPAAVHLRGTLDPALLRRAFELLVERHESLRTRFRAKDGVPEQIVVPLAEWSLPVFDLTQHPLDVALTEAMSLAAEQSREPFDLSNGPLLRTTLFRLDPEHHLLILTIHHIISDGWSEGIMLRDLHHFYGALRENREPSLAPLAIQYPDFASWQRSQETRGEFEGDLSYWRTRLALLPTVDLPTDRPRPPRQTFNGAVLSFELPGELIGKLKTVGQSRGATLYMTLLSAFNVLVGRYAGSDDIPIGIPIAGRTHPELEDQIGFFVNTVAIRTHLSGNPCFVDLVDQVKQGLTEALEHQNAPFEKIVEELGQSRDGSHSPLFQVMFALQTVPFEELTLPGLTMAREEIHTGTARFDLTINLRQVERGLVGVAEYNTDLFDSETIERLCRSYHRLIQSVIATPAQRVSELTLLDPDEEQRMLVEWNATERDTSADRMLHELVEQHAVQTPDGIAVQYEQFTLTYRQLDSRANQLAHRLQDLGVGPEVIVGLCQPRSENFIVAIIAVLKAGGAYLPLDPTYPEARLSLMLEDSGARVLITDTELRGTLPRNISETVYIDEFVWENGCPHVERSVSPENLAYVIYTSGSTGRPKGVQLHHRGLSNLIYSLATAFRVHKNSRFLQFSSPSFDASVAEIAPTLGMGGTLVIPARETQLSPEKLSCFINEHHVESAIIPPAVLQLFPEGSLSLKVLIVAGEQCPVGLVKKWAPERLFINGYGPTETTVCATAGDCDPTQNKEPLIGSPISNVSCYVLNQALMPVFPGVVGELFIGGLSVGRGYHNRAGLTAGSFLPDPFSKIAGSRMYRTGDLVRWQGDGTLEFLGRIDDQVKVRGLRIELGEIESHLAKIHGVSKVAVVAQKVSAGNSRLIAHLVCEGEQPYPEDLKKELGGSLPDYMIPAAFVFLDALPLSPSGKVDRQALPAPVAEDFATSKEARPPGTPSENRVYKVWRELLALEQFSVDDDFFTLGGHSLLATQVASRIKDDFQLDIPLRELFEASTVAELAARLDTLLEEDSTATPIGRIERSDNIVPSLAQERLWFLDQLEPLTSTYNISGAFRLKGRLDSVAFDRSIALLFERHELFRAFFVNRGGRPHVTLKDTIVPAVEKAEIPGGDQNSDAALFEFLEEFCARPFSLGEPPLARIAIVCLSDEEQVVALNMHHIISDGWSVTVLMRDLVETYNALINGVESGLPPLEVQYFDYAAWQREYLSGERLTDLVEYWSDEFAGAPRLLELPTDRPRPPVQTFTAESVEKTLDAALCRDLEQRGRHGSATLFMTLLSGFYGLMHRLSGQDDIVVGTPIAGRNRSELEHLIGFFLNLLPLRAQVNSDMSFEELLAATRETTLGAYAHQDLPFEQILEKVQPERSLAHTPLFQVFFNMIEIPFANGELAGLTIEPLKLPDLGSKFDLTSYVIRGDDGSITLRWVYNADLFDQARISGMLDQYELLLRGAVDQPNAPIAKHLLLTDGERQRLPDPREKLDPMWYGPIHKALTANAAERGERLAVEDTNGSWTYAELETCSNQLAHWLIESGVQKGDTVAIYAHRSAPLVRAILGVLKTGSAYVVLDPAYPEIRLQKYLEILRPKALICLKDAGPLQVELGDTELPQIDLPPLGVEDPFELSQQPLEVPRIPIDRDDIAVITFTSGSTGEPKAVLGRQGSLTHFLPWQTERFELSAKDRFSMLSGLAHDPLQRDVFTALWCGGAIIVPEQGKILEPGWLTGWARERGITVSHLTPAMAQLLTMGNPDDEEQAVPSLRLAFTVGDRLLKQDVLRLTEGAPNLVFVNMYGSTETQRAVGHYVVEEPSALAQEVVPVGHGMPDVQLLIVNEQGELSAPGEPGEIWIRSPHLAAGYLRDEELTERRFIANPFTENPNDRIYRTGDLGRYRSDGVVEFAGRADDQVQIRGFRVELGEVESVLLAEDQVRECAVVVQGEVGSSRMVAYVVSHDEMLDVEALKQGVQKQLPDYMRPAAYVSLDRIPLTPNGKLDRQALPRPDLSELQGACVPPRTQTEEILCVIVAELLGLEAVGITDSFFELGGHSLLATQAISRIRDAFQVDLPLRVLFERPTIEAMARAIDKVGSEETHNIEQISSAQPVSLVKDSIHASTSRSYFTSLGQENFYLLQQMSSDSSFLNMPVILELQGDVDYDRLKDTLNKIVERHESLRTSFVLHNGEVYQTVHELADLEVDYIEANEDSISQNIHECLLPFDLSKAPLIRAKLVKLADLRFIFIFNVNHIVCDGISSQMLIRDFCLLYEAKKLPPLRYQYKDFAWRQRKALESGELEENREFWLRQFEGTIPTLVLPTDYSRPSLKDYRGGRLDFKINSKQKEKIDKFLKDHELTLYMFLLSSLNILLSKYSGQEDIVIGTPIAGRYHPEFQEIVGLFIDNIAIRSYPEKDKKIEDYFEEIKQIALGAYENQAFPFKQLLTELNYKARPGRSALFDVALLVQNYQREELKLEDFVLSKYQSDYQQTAKLDMSVEVVELDGSIDMSIIYASSLFKRTTIEKIKIHFVNLLEEIIDAPQRTIGEYVLNDFWGEKKPDQFSCFIIGDSTLPIKCAESIMRRGHIVHGLISNDRDVQAFARARNIPCVEVSRKKIKRFLGRVEFDYLFSVNNALILKEELSYPKKLCINYHDSPLPRYAGVYATTWAIMNNETEHAISWHAVDEGIDTGDILKQDFFGIENNETAMSLNLKCYEKAIASFDELVGELAIGKIEKVKQNIDKHEYFGLHKRPRSAAVIDFADSAENIGRFCRSLDFGRYPNELAHPKIGIHNEYYLVKEVLVSKTSAPNIPPGTVLEINKNKITVATGSGAIQIENVFDISGVEISVDSIVSHTGLKERDLIIIDESMKEKITEINADLCKEERFWLNRLKNLEPVELSFNRILSQRKESVGDGVSCCNLDMASLPVNMENSNILMVALFGAYLSKNLRRDSFNIGYANENILDVNEHIGELFAKKIPIRIELKGDCTLNSLLDQMDFEIRSVEKRKTFILDVFARYEELHSRFIEYQKTVSISVIFAEKNGRKFKLDRNQLILLLSDNGLSFVYNGADFGNDDILQLGERFVMFAEKALKMTDTPLSDLEIVSENEKEKLVVEFNRTHSPFEENVLVQQLIEQQAKRTPDRIAIVCEEKRVTYKQLDSRSNQIARRLRNRGIQPDHIVALITEKSEEMIISILGVLKSGGAYLPIAPKSPELRTAYIIEDSEPKIILTQKKFKKDIEKLVKDSSFGGEVLYLDDEDIEEVPDETLAIVNDKCDLVYIIYTSGSTGKPKGVMVEHRNLLGYLNAFNSEFHLSEDDRVVQQASYTFDAFVEEMYPVLMKGGALIIPSKELVIDVEKFIHFLQENQITLMSCSPLVLNEIDKRKPELSIHTFIGGGDVLKASYIDNLLEIGSVYNTYGPTETTVCASYYKCQKDVDSKILIGKPIKNYCIYILDEQLNILPVGVPGELCIAGAGVARGYLNREELTKEKFVENIFGQGKLYRTGDLAKWNENGEIDYLGRIDNQINLRGFRIELGEIESRLVQHPEIDEAVVVNFDETEGQEQYLAAYYTAENAISAGDLRKHIGQCLPEYMLPAYFVRIPSVPMNSHGKVDRSSLPLPQVEVTNYEAPGNEVEKELQAIWSDVLHLEKEKISVEASFFEIGGNSIVATRAISRIRDQLSVNVPLRALFELPTLRELAKHVEHQLIGGAVVSPIDIVERSERMPLSLVQERLWFLDQFEPGNSTYNMFGAFRLTGDLDVSLIERCWKELFARHELLRAGFASREGKPQLVFYEEVSPSLERVEILSSKDIGKRDLTSYINEFASRPFDLGDPPLVRASLIRRSDTDHVVGLCIHHVISDGWSLAILMRDLVALYNGMKTGEPTDFPALPVQYVDYATWQRSYLSGERLASLAAYWSDKLSGVPLLLDLPTDRPRPPVQTFTGRTVERRLDVSLGKELEQLGRKGATTLFMTLLAGFYGLMHRLSGQGDIVVGTPIAGRNRSELEHLVGFFLNLLPLRATLDSGTTFEQLLRATRETTLGAYAHQELPFEQIIEEVKPKRSLAHTPLFQVLFNMLEFPFGKTELAGLTIEPVELPDLGSKFDLTSYVIPGEDGSITLRWAYNADLFDEARVEMMLDQYELLLKGVVERPEAAIGTHQLLGEGDRAKLPDPRETLDDTWHGPIYNALTAHAAENAHRLVVEDRNGSWTYRELESLSNRLAHWLIGNGVQRGDTVAIYAHRSGPLVRAILGVMKTGGSYLVLDPAYPENRLQRYLEITKPKALISLTAAGLLPESLTTIDGMEKPVRVDLPPLGQKEPEDLSRQKSESPGMSVDQDDIAVITFTSGSTGEPKAVLGRHDALTHFLPWQKERFELGAKDRFSMLSGLAHDPLQRDIFTALWCGGAIIIPDPEKILEPGWLARWAKEQGITVSNLTPAMALLLSVASKKDEVVKIPSLRLSFVVGDRLLKQDVLRLNAQAPNIKVVNLYGSTETQRALGHFVIDDPKDLVQPTVPLGNHMPGVQLLVVNEGGVLCAPGELGEIWIRSPHLAAGYMEDEGLTEQRFTANPFTEDPNDRIYRTGDLGRYRSDGMVEFAGRADDQVQIRGFRVEIGEIVSCLNEHPSVQDSVVVLYDENDGEAAHQNVRLVAYVVAADGDVETTAMRNQLKAVLPEYMIPTEFIRIDRIPLTPNGKLDKTGLPKPDRQSTEKPFVEPRNSTEKTILSICQKVLNLESISVDDNFFEVGGHSLLAAQVVARVQDAFEVRIRIIDLFANPTIAGLAEIVDALLLARKSKPSADSSSADDVDREEWEL